MKTPAQKILNRPVAEWPRLLDACYGVVPAGTMIQIEHELAALIQKAALLHVYIASRYNAGLGDQGHESSAKHANATLIKIRRALGFSYPKNTPFLIQP